MTYRQKYEPVSKDTLPGCNITLVVRPEIKRALDKYSHLKFEHTGNVVKEILFEKLDSDELFQQLIKAELAPPPQQKELLSNIVEEVLNK
jgi:hypothetical protein